MQSTRRQNSLTGDWVLVSPQRNNRPWVGSQESLPEIPAVPHDKNCPLCPGNQRAGDEKNPDYTGPFVF
ncbi:MAG: galactose-1-phosphate uridylyltransferase, partial [Halieaceae bacterium]